MSTGPASHLLYPMPPGGLPRAQAVRGSYDINLGYYVTSFNICRHHTYPCGWLGADVVADLSRY